MEFYRLREDQECLKRYEDVYESEAAQRLTRAYTRACIQENLQDEQSSEENDKEYFDQFQAEGMRYIQHNEQHDLTGDQTMNRISKSQSEFESPLITPR